MNTLTVDIKGAAGFGQSRRQRDMAKPELLATMRLLAALESWAWAQGKPLPAYLSADIQAAVTALERELLT